MASLPAFECTLVLYIVTPLSIMTLASPVLRQVCSAIKRTLQGPSGSRIHVQFVPEHTVFRSLEIPTTSNSDFELLCFSVYDRIRQPVDRQMSRRFFEHGERTRSYFQEPAFTLARPIYTKVTFHHQTPVRVLDVVDRHTLLHIGYQTSSCGKWVLAAGIDQRGETREVGVWLSDPLNGERGVVELVWDFAVQYGRKANVEWRIVIAKLGGMDQHELDGMSSSRRGYFY